MNTVSRFGRHIELATLAGVSAALLCVRLFAATRVGFGDSEALYASYALHPQPAYLDHPGLVGVVARVIGGGTAPGPPRTHVVTSLLSTLVPWAVAGACRACGATARRSFAAALIFALAPEIAIGLFALTPDLLLALAWTAALALGALALRSKPGSARAAAAFAGTGLLGGVAAAAKVTGAMFMAGLAIAYASRTARPHARTLAPWAGLAAGAFVVSPIVLFEAGGGWPMLRHRLVDTQVASGPSLRNVAAFVVGQLAYLSPLTAVLAGLAGRELWRARSEAIGRLLFACCVAPLALLLPLCLWSRVAEPHWPAPALIALVPAAARARVGPSRRLMVASSGLAAALVVIGHAAVLTPWLVRFAPATYQPRLDLTNELYGWPEVMNDVREEARMTGAMPDGGRPSVAVVGPHWVICAQLEAALRGRPYVGCDTALRDDFDDWSPRSRWRLADTIIWVTDDRFPISPDLPAYATARSREIRVDRGGRTVRRFTIAVLTRSAVATRSVQDDYHSAPSPAALRAITPEPAPGP